MKTLADRHVGLRSLTDTWLDATTSQGVLMFHFFSAIAEYERNQLRERTMAGLAAARAGGRVGGRPSKMTPDKAATAAMETMQKHDPQAYAQIADPQTHFSTLGREIQDRIWALSEELVPMRGSETPLEYLGLVNMAKLRTREMAYQELIYDGLPPEPEEMELASRQQDEAS